MTHTDIELASFVTQIVEKTLEALRGQDVFDEDTISRLRALAGTGHLQTFQSVVDAIVGGQEENRAAP